MFTVSIPKGVPGVPGERAAIRPGVVTATALYSPGRGFAGDILEFETVSPPVYPCNTNRPSGFTNVTTARSAILAATAGNAVEPARGGLREAEYFRAGHACHGVQALMK
jgi:hypothetical protein